ncbi:MAG TPA: hypothetical protein VFQ61_02505 [Polyangiaceae bacterium]|nr:hypothetical protein [Polyangiaceae bacterium]
MAAPSLLVMGLMIRISSLFAGSSSQGSGGLSRIRRIAAVSTALVALFALGSTMTGCETGGVGDPCTPEDEYLSDFAGFSIEEVNVESRSFQCETRVCLVNHFQGRVKCPYGNAEGTPGCVIPGTSKSDPQNVVSASVDPQLKARPANNAVYCSCRCAGPEKNAKYCECPSGFTCANLVDDYKIPNSAGQLAGSYCVREGTEYQKGAYAGVGNCKFNERNCGEVSETGEPK